MLNAKVHADEAKIVAMAGHKGAVTVATNMAGRGTDIMLGGSVEFLADDELRKKGLEPVGETADEYEAAWPETLERVKAQVAAEHDEVRDLGGLYVVGTERHESRRIDNQLRGRSGRQGDPGESRFYLSLEDELMRLFKSDWVDRVLQVLKIPDDVPIENKRVTSAIANAQGQVESQNFESRKNVLKYDDVMDRQRKVIYGERREVLEGADIEDQVRVVHRRRRRPAPSPARPQGLVEEWDLEQLWTDLGQLWPVSLDRETYLEDVGGEDGLDRDELIKTLQADAQAAYDAREAEVGEEVMRELERRVLLSVLDRKWREHLYEMDYLREGIYLRAYSQRDPLVEYQREGFEMFAAMMDGIKEEAVGFLFNLEVSVRTTTRTRTSRRTRSSSRCGSRSRARRSPRWRPLPGCAAADPGVAADAGQGPRAGQAAAEPLLLGAHRAGRGRGQGQHGRPTPTTRSPRSAATRSAPAARARSTRCATACRRADRPDRATRAARARAQAKSRAVHSHRPRRCSNRAATARERSP